MNPTGLHHRYILHTSVLQHGGHSDTRRAAPHDDHLLLALSGQERIGGDDVDARADGGGRGGFGGDADGG